MRIYCPKCKVGYEVDREMIPEGGKKLRCSYCGFVFTAMPEDLIEVPQFHPSEPSAAEDVNEAEKAEAAEEVSAAGDETVSQSEDSGDIKEIFQRLNEQTEDLFKTEQKIPVYKRFWTKIKSRCGLNSKARRNFLWSAVAIILLLLLYNYRFEVVRSVPAMDWVYRAAGVKAKIPGEGLEFQNIVWNDFEDDYVRTLEIKGFIANRTKQDVLLPVTRIEMLDKDANLLQSIHQKPSIKMLKPGGRVAIGIIVKKPSPLTKYIFLTFTDDK